QRRIALIALVIGPDLRLDPRGLVAQQQMHIGRRLRQWRVDRLRERMDQLWPILVRDPQRRAAMPAEMPLRRAFYAADHRVPFADRAAALNLKRLGIAHDVDRITPAAGAFAAARAVAALVGAGGVA